MSFAFIDYLVIAIYFLLIVFIGLYISRNKEIKTNRDEFILAGRRVTLPFFVATLVATWYGSILGIGEFVYRDGLVGWVCFSFTYYIAAALFAGFIAKKVRESEVSTIPEYITKYYGEKAGFVAALVVLIITIPASYLLMLGIIIQLFVSIDLWIAIVLGAILSLIYLFFGGLKADIYTNTAQFIIMYLGFFILLAFTMANFGTPVKMVGNLKPSYLYPFGNYSFQYIFSWFIIAMQTFIDPSFHQRCAAAKTPKIAQKGIFISIIFWAVFDILTVSTALYARAYIDIKDPLMTYPVLSNMVLPSFWKGFFVAAMLSVIMSTLDSYAFISGVTIGNDLLTKIKKFNKINTNHLIRIGLAITAILGIIIAIVLPSVIDLIYKTSSIAIPGLLIPLLFTYSKKYFIDLKKINFIIISSVLVSLFWTIFKSNFSNSSNIAINYLAEFEPMLVGITFSIILSLIFLKKRK
jgi:solute:Na+ symporter, SSS family